MKKIIVLIVILMLMSCGVNNADEQYETLSTQSSSVINVYVEPSSSSTTAQSSSSEPPYHPIQTLYVAEMGTVCVGFNIDAVQNWKATEGYMAMNSICGNRAQVTTGVDGKTADIINDWLINGITLNYNTRALLVSDVDSYGSSLRFYDAVDGYLRYVYIEPVGDGLGLVKRGI